MWLYQDKGPKKLPDFILKINSLSDFYKGEA